MGVDTGSALFVAGMFFVGVTVMACALGGVLAMRQRRGEKQPEPSIQEQRELDRKARELANDIEAARRDEAAVQARKACLSPRTPLAKLESAGSFSFLSASPRGATPKDQLGGLADYDSFPDPANFERVKKRAASQRPAPVTSPAGADANDDDDDTTY